MGFFIWREEDPRKRIILAPYVVCVQFTGKRSYLCRSRTRILQDVSSTRIFLDEGSLHLEDPSTMKTMRA